MGQHDMGKPESRRRKTLARLVRLRELETLQAARASADLVSTQDRLTSLAQRSARVVAEQSGQRVGASADHLRREYDFTRSLSELSANSASQARELEPQITNAAQLHGQSKHRADRLKDKLGQMNRAAALRANHDSAAQTGKVARKLNSKH